MRKTFAAIAVVLSTSAAPAVAQEGSFVDGFDDGVLSETRYRVRASNENSSVIVDNGELRLEAVGDGGGPGRAALDLLEQTDFLQADLTLDGTSMAEGTGMSRVMLSGVLYNDQRSRGLEGEGSLGDVLVQLSLRMRGDGTVDNLVCAFRSADARFGTIETIALDGFTECGRFETDVVLGAPYRAAIRIDRGNRRLLFTLGGETLEHVIRGNMFEPTDDARSSVVAQVNGTGRAVAFADNVSTAVDRRVGAVGPANGALPGALSGGAADELPTDDDALSVPANLLNDSSGCSVGGPSPTRDPLLLVLAALAALSLAWRRGRARRHP